MEWPAQSLDLNPINWGWGSLTCLCLVLSFFTCMLWKQCQHPYIFGTVKVHISLLCSVTITWFLIVFLIKHWLLLFLEFDLAHAADKTFVCCISITFHYFDLFSCQHLEIYNSSASVWAEYGFSIFLWLLSQVQSLEEQREGDWKKWREKDGSRRWSLQKVQQGSICFMREQASDEDRNEMERETTKIVKHQGREK